MEADLSRFHRLDLRDLHRRDEQGRRALTLRMIWVRIHYLPSDSALAIAENDGKRPWSATESLLADIWELKANEHRDPKKSPQPIRHPKRPAANPQRSAAEEIKRRRAMARHRQQYQRYYGIAA